MNQNNIKHIKVSTAAINFLELPLAASGEKVRELIKALLETEDIEDREWQLEKINKDFSLWYVPQGGPGKASGHGLLNINRKSRFQLTYNRIRNRIDATIIGGRPWDSNFIGYCDWLWDNG